MTPNREDVLTIAAALRDYMRHLMFETEEYTLQVHIHEEIVVVPLQVPDGRGLVGHAGIVEGDVDPAEPLEGSPVQVGHRAGVADVDFREFHLALLQRLDFILEACALSGAEAGHQ
jgi:hypothetical protein